MNPDEELRLAGHGARREPGPVSASFHPPNANLGAGASFPTSLSRSDAAAWSNHGTYHRPHPYGVQYHDRDNDNHRDPTAQDYYLPHVHPESLTMSDTRTRPTLHNGASSLPEAHASGLDPTGTPPIGTTKPAHRNPYQYLNPQPYFVSSNLQRSSSDSRLQKSGKDLYFSSPFLHPLSLRMKSSRTPSPFTASTRRSRYSHKSGTRFTIGSSRPNSPTEPERRRGSSPVRLPPPFTVRGFLALRTFSKAIALLFVCCVLVLSRAFFRVGHSAEGFGVPAHGVTDPRPRPGSASRSSDKGMGTDDPKFRIEDRGSGNEQAHVWLEKVEGMYEYQYDWKMGEYEIEHDDDGGDRYDDEYEHEDLLDLAL